MHQIIHGNCFDHLDLLAKADAIITDPPYGISWAGHSASTLTWNKIENDEGNLDLRPILNMKCLVVSFGANCYPHMLPHRGRWLCWDKRVVESADRMLGSPFELAWTNRTKGFDKMYRIMHGGVINADGRGIKRVHPTQKPIELMRRIIEDFTEPGATIVDPFCGSGTTGVACNMTGRNFIGIEIDERYAQISRDRVGQKDLYSDP
jgi:DNA modification methylase